MWFVAKMEISRKLSVCIALAESSQEGLSLKQNSTHLHNTWAVKRTYESTGNNIVPKWGR